MISKMVHFVWVLMSAAIFLFGGEPDFTLNDLDYFQRRGLDVLVFHNWYDGYFGDAKITGIEIIHHGVPTATNGDVRLNPTPVQWDPIPGSVERTFDRKKNRAECLLSYPEYGFEFTIRTEARDGGIRIGVYLQEPLPAALEGRAGFKLQFLPSAYFEKMYLMDGHPGLFPRYPAGPIILTESGAIVPAPISRSSPEAWCR